MTKRAIVPPAFLRKGSGSPVMNDLSYDIAVTIFERQREVGLTGYELAERAGMRPTNISRILSGHTMPSPAVLKRIAEAMDCQLVISFVPNKKEEDPS